MKRELKKKEYQEKKARASMLDSNDESTLSLELKHAGQQ